MSLTLTLAYGFFFIMWWWQDGTTVLFHIGTWIDNDKISISRLLIEHGADINAKDKVSFCEVRYLLTKHTMNTLLLQRGRTMLHNLCERMVGVKGATGRMAQMFIELGADLQVLDNVSLSQPMLSCVLHM
jgi:ankyrin repeat protein